MKGYRRVLLYILLVLLIGSAVTAFFIFKNKAKAPASETKQNPIVENKRKSITCEEFNRSYEFVAGTGKQPQGFPQPFGNTIVCGTLTAANTTYYIIDVDKEKLFSHYGSYLKSQGYTIEVPKPGRDGDDASIEFIAPNGDHGDVYWHGGTRSYEITYVSK